MLDIENTLKNRISWVVWSRLAFLAVMTTSALSLEVFYSESFPDELYRFIWLGGLFSVVSLILNRLFDLQNLRHLIAWAQVVVDCLLVSFVISNTGGVSSAFFILYGLNILSSGVVLMQTGVIAGSLISVMSYLVVVFWEGGSLSAPPSEIVSRVVFQTSSLILAGAMIAWLFRHRLRLMKSLEKTEEDLQSLSHLQAAIVDHIPSGILMAQFDGSVIFANRVAKEIYGADPVGSSLEDLHLHEVPKNASLREVKITSFGGLDKVVRCESVELNPSIRIMLFNDVTNIKNLEEQLNYREKLASVGQLAAGLAHEIKNPLASLSGSIQLMQSEIKFEESHERLMNIVTRETDRLDGLLQSFLNYAKPSQLKLTEHELGPLVEDVVELQRQAMDPSSSLKVQVEVTSGVGMEMDADKMKQVIWNLVSNAAAATGPNGRVVVRAFEIEDQGVQIEVEDNGCGISDDLKAKIFEPFFTRKESGTGLGLALVYQIVDAHGGSIGFDSVPGQGSRFWMKFKKKQNSESQVAA